MRIKCVSWNLKTEGTQDQSSCGLVLDTKNSSDKPRFEIDVFEEALGTKMYP